MQYNYDSMVQSSTVLEIPKLPSSSQLCQYSTVQRHETRLAQVPEAVCPHYLFHSHLLSAWRSPTGTSMGISAPRSIACCSYHFVVRARLVNYSNHPTLRMYLAWVTTAATVIDGITSTMLDYKILIHGVLDSQSYSVTCVTVYSDRAGYHINV